MMKKTLPLFLLTVVALVGVGLLVMASASTQQGKTYDHFFNRQVIWLAVSVFVWFIVIRFDYHNWQKWLVCKGVPLLPVIFYLAVVVLLALTISPIFKHKINGSYRWLVLGSFSIQPGEFAKLMIIIATAIWMDHIKWRVSNFWLGVVVPAAMLGVFALFLFLEKDLGATAVIGVLGLSLMCVAGVRKRFLAPFALVAIMLGSLWVLTDTHRLNRISKGYWQLVVNPLTPSEGNPHVSQSISAFVLGGLDGVGYTNSTQKHHYLQESHTDFVFAIGGEELGFFFSIGVLILYGILLVCGVLISLHAPDRLGRLLAFGMVLLLVFQGAFNIGVVTGLFPTKGLALPFISYGGSNLLTAAVAVGTLFNIGRQIEERDEHTRTRVVRDALNTV